MSLAETTLARTETVSSASTYQALLERWENYTPHTTELRLGIVPTELQEVRMPGCHRLFIQDESVQPGNSFKYNGMANAVERMLGTDSGKGSVERLYIGSAGNAGTALVAAAGRHGLGVVVDTPSSLVDSKRALLTSGHSIVRAMHDSVEAATAAAQADAESDPYGAFIHAYDDLDAIAGQGFVAKRALAGLMRFGERGAIDMRRERIALLIQRGGGSLLAGFACELYRLKEAGGLGDNVQLYEVQPEASVHFYDGLDVEAPGQYAQSILDDPRFVAGTVSIDDVDTGRAATDMAHKFHKRFEPSGLAGVAAFKALQSDEQPTTFLAVLSGANYSRPTYDYFTDAPRRAQWELLHHGLGKVSLERVYEPTHGRGLNPCDYGRYAKRA